MYKIHMEIAIANNNLDEFQNEWRPNEDLLKDINTYLLLKRLNEQILNKIPKPEPIYIQLI